MLRHYCYRYRHEFGACLLLHRQLDEREDVSE